VNDTDTAKIDRMAEDVIHAIARRDAAQRRHDEAQRDLSRRWNALRSFAAARLPVAMNARVAVDRAMDRAAERLRALAADAATVRCASCDATDALEWHDVPDSDQKHCDACHAEAMQQAGEAKADALDSYFNRP
jgi:hypothetical protein